MVTLLGVPFKMQDDDIRSMLSKFGSLDSGPIIHHKNDLGFPNLERSIMFTDLKYDIASYLRINGYTVQVWYNSQPRTCKLCGQRNHEMVDCPLNVSVRRPAPKPRVESTANDDNGSTNKSNDGSGKNDNVKDSRRKTHFKPPKQLTREEEVIKSLNESISLLENAKGKS